ncbi:molybdenum cofactor biosynthesis protein [Methanoculleus sp. FWC-SCC1]|uniref:Molybdenum cofactor biosynthesis protein n=1 Tax=Methanoculleus frigidifontis TaxID=2584085 RepID=A0ABT8M9A9_9EURY|nr:molybdopterin-binding protein [Methanoculleus sp. FWC-SCC1]MDN7024512.1 molybdenum cofactor biosynthesis protein [Methanoculleus sp. FWC-SCC1]
MPRRYLSLTTLADALSLMKRTFPPSNHTETVSLEQAVGRVTAQPLYARYSVPSGNVAAMDGYAVQSRETVGAGDRRPKVLVDAHRVNTGEVVPPMYDAVIMVEDVWREDGPLTIRKAASPGQFIRRAGDDIRSGDLIVPRGHQIRPFDIGALGAYGIADVPVRAVTIGLVPTGSDLVPIGQAPLPGQTVESNTCMAGAYLAGMGATCRRYGRVPDDSDAIREAVGAAVRESDLVIVSAGTSAGTRDFTTAAIADLGEVLVHGVATRPGKPVVIGSVDAKPVLGLPGNPVATQTMLRELVAPLLEGWGLSPYQQYGCTVRLARTVTSDVGFEEFVPVSVGKVNGVYSAAPHPRGGGVQMAAVRANGYLRIPASGEGFAAGCEVPVTLTVPPGYVDRTLLCIGVREQAITELADALTESGYLLHCCAADTIAALLALQENTCYAAAVMVPECEPLVRDLAGCYCPATEPVRVRIAAREIGIASRGGLGLPDLASARVATHPRGTAPRLLLDALLPDHGIDPFDLLIAAEVRSHDAAAAAVCGGLADAGICSAGAAAAAGLGFVPFGTESYELWFRPEVRDDGGMQEVLRILRSQQFSSRLGERQDYLTDRTGEFVTGAHGSLIGVSERSIS